MPRFESILNNCWHYRKADIKTMFYINMFSECESVNLGINQGNFKKHVYRNTMSMVVRNGHKKWSRVKGKSFFEIRLSLEVNANKKCVKCS